MPRLTDTRRKMLRTTAQLLRRQGYAATSWRQVVAEADAPWGSQSHHFPQGKEQLAAEAVAMAGERYRRLLVEAFAGVSPAEAVARWAEVAARELEASGWADGCPVATVTLETAHTSDRLAEACSAAFTGWRTALADAIERHGGDRAAAEAQATVVLASIEGALLLARADRTPEPLHTVAAQLGAVLAADG
ncbi:MAG: TetR/AcrR family transcriptional regulator [Actinomycetota bacterium]|nr:TetR/AcrR family transcriptional regulator [Actinomycetota bacterium]